MVFNHSTIKYVSSFHAEERLIERGNCTWEEARAKVINLAENGELILEVDDYRYMKNEDYYLPCIQDRYLGANTYRVKSVLTWDMVDYRLQNIIDNYHIKKKKYSLTR
jgi:hypothetical protein